MHSPSILPFQELLDSPLVLPNKLDSDASPLAALVSAVATWPFFCTCVARTAIGSSEARRHGYGGSGNRFGSNVYEKPVLVAPAAAEEEDDDARGGWFEVDVDFDAGGGGGGDDGWRALKAAWDGRGGGLA